MGLKKLAEKVEEYQQRLKAGRAHRIEPEHVEKVLDKLRRKEADLLVRIGTEPDAEERADLERKLGVAREHIARAEWLLTEMC
jgi:hypothetical protein